MSIMNQLLKEKLAEDGLYGDSKEITDYTSKVEDGELYYIVTVLNWANSKEVEHSYSNSELLSFMFDKITSLERKLDDEGIS
jgi:hypothetical protein